MDVKYDLVKNENKEVYVFHEEIIPEKIIHFDKTYNILRFPNEHFKIKEFRIIIIDNILKELLVINSWHPNASSLIENTVTVRNEIPPEVQIFCLPEKFKNMDLGNNYDIQYLYSYFIKLLKTYNYNNSYWILWTGLEYQEDFETTILDNKFESLKDDITSYIKLKKPFKKEDFYNDGFGFLSLLLSKVDQFISDSSEELKSLTNKTIDLYIELFLIRLEKETIKFLSWNRGENNVRN